MDKATLVPANVVIKNPENGTITASTIKEVGLQRWRITFPPQTVFGTYHLRIQTNVTDLAGNHLDQDGDGVPGEPDADVFESTFSLVPVDLEVTSATLSTNQLWVNAQANVSWTGHNALGTQLASDWTDAVYLSADNCWDVQDMLLTKVRHEGGLASNAVWFSSADVFFLALQPGQYYVLVRTDVQQEEREVNETNNTAVVGPFTFDLPLLPAAGASVSGTLTSSSRSRWYALTLKQGDAVSLLLNSSTSAAPANVFVSLAAIPTRASHDYTGRERFGQPGSPNRGLMFTAPSAGTYYVLVDGDQLTSALPFELSAQVSSFALSGISPTRQANSETALVTLAGAGFDDSLSIQFVGPGGTIREPASVELASSSEARLTLALTNWPPGTYSIHASQGGAIVQLPNAFEIVAEGAPRLEFKFVVPGRLAARGPIRQTLWLEYKNTGTLPMAAPLFRLDAPPGALVAVNPAWITPGAALQTNPPGFADKAFMMALGPKETPWVLPPGYEGRFPA